MDRIDRIADPLQRAGGHTNPRLRADGTFGNDRDRALPRRGGASEIEIGGSSGFRGWGNLEIEVPAGREVKLHLAVGRATLAGVSGDYTLDTWGSDVDATDIEGHFLFDTGSGDVHVSRARGTMRFDTGSGDCVAEHVTGDLLDMDTGNGDLELLNTRMGRSTIFRSTRDPAISRSRCRATRTCAWWPSREAGGSTWIVPARSSSAGTRIIRCCGSARVAAGSRSTPAAGE